MLVLLVRGIAGLLSAAPAVLAVPVEPVSDAYAVLIASAEHVAFAARVVPVHVPAFVVHGVSAALAAPAVIVHGGQVLLAAFAVSAADLQVPGVADGPVKAAAALASIRSEFGKAEPPAALHEPRLSQ